MTLYYSICFSAYRALPLCIWGEGVRDFISRVIHLINLVIQGVYIVLVQAS
jgi:hypothetical protein